MGIFFVWNVSGPPSLRSSPNIRNVCSGLPFHYAQSSTLLVLKAAAARGFLLWFHKLSLRGPAFPDDAHIKQISGPLRELHSHRKLIITFSNWPPCSSYFPATLPRDVYRFALIYDPSALDLRNLNTTTSTPPCRWTVWSLRV